MRRGRHVRDSVRITAAQAAVVLRALADAEAWRRKRAAGWCRDCEHHPAGACDEHVSDLDQADAYRDLAAELARTLPPAEAPEDDSPRMVQP